MRCGVMLLVVSVGCATSGPPPTSKTPTDDAPQEPESEDAQDAGDDMDSAGAPASDLDFSEDVAAPSSTVSAQPERRPSGAFDVCGDRCRDNVGLKNSLQDVDDDDGHAS